MNSHYLDFLKSFKKFIASHFPEIEHYQFNYGDKAFLNYKLYQEHVKEYPMCMINLTDISVDDNKAFFRYIGGAHSDELVEVLANNHNLQETILCDFKWVTMQVQLKINLASLADLLDYHNHFISAFPKDFMFYAYRYNSFININKYMTNWEPSHDMDGVHYRSADQATEGFAWFGLEPLFKVTSTTKTKNVEDEISLDIGLEIRLRVPNVIGNQTIDNRIINGIQIVENLQTETTPILIDMNNDVFSDRQQKFKQANILAESNFNIENNTCEVPISLRDQIINKACAIYIVDDSTSNAPNILWEEITLVEDTMLNDDLDTFIFPLKDNLTNFKFGPLSITELLIFD